VFAGRLSANQKPPPRDYRKTPNPRLPRQLDAKKHTINPQDSATSADQSAGVEVDTGSKRRTALHLRVHRDALADAFER
jgi:hypothetical protein